MSDLYPFKFYPQLKEKLWAGQKIKTVLGKDCGSLEICGEIASKREVHLVPACIKTFTVEPNPTLVLLETYIDRSISA